MKISYDRMAAGVAVVAFGVIAAGVWPLSAAAPEAIDGFALHMPQPGETSLHVLTPGLLELVYVNTKAPDPSRVADWDFVTADGTPTLPAASAISVLVDGNPVPVTAVGFKRRPLYAPLSYRDLRIDNRLYLKLSGAVNAGQSVVVTNPDGTAWNSTLIFAGTAAAMQYNPAIHVNLQGYVPNFPKKAMIGYYLGSFGEMDVPATTFSLVDEATGAVAFTGPLKRRADVGFAYTPTPYQKVLEADFSQIQTPGRYRLMVDGLGASQPFEINDGIAMNFTRAYALGLYHQRCGAELNLPYTRHVHGACHTALADVPTPQSSFANTWQMISSVAATGPTQTAPVLANESAQLYPFVKTGKIDVSGGHHDAGDYSKYTIDSAEMIHALVFAADAFPGAGALDNLGIPESGDGKSDLLQEAKWEADFLAKLQDDDGGFYFLVYPKNRKYEDNVLPDQGDPQVVWPKSTASTAASVAVLAELGSSPLFRQQFPEAADLYLAKARAGWSFLMNAIAKYGKDGAYQYITHYGCNFNHDDELAWAAAAMFAATGDPAYQQQLIAWYDPSSRNTRRWSWLRCFEGYGCALRTYAFAARTGRLGANQLDPTYLAKCVAELIAAGDDQTSRSNACAYGSGFEAESKRVRAAGWYFSLDRAFDIAVASQLANKPGYQDALLTNVNYEGGCNPLNLSYITGMGGKRQREIVHQYAQNDRRVLPPSGLPLGNIQSGFAYLSNYGRELGSLTYPNDGATTATYPFYDRWGDSYNTTTEFIDVNQSRALACLAYLAAATPTATQPWNSTTAEIVVPSAYVAADEPVTLTLSSDIDLTGAEVVWEAQGQQPTLGGTSYTFTPGTVGTHWVEAEIHWIDGRRAFAANTFSTYMKNNDAEFENDAHTVALYHFNGDYQDASGNGLHLTPAGNVSLASDNSGWHPNPVGQVARFGGLGDTLTVQIPDSRIQPGSVKSQFSFEAHIYPRAFKAYGVSNFPVLSLYQWWDSSFQIIDGKWNVPHAPTVSIGAYNLISSAQWASLVTPQTWHKIKMTYDKAGLFRLWIDDVMVVNNPSVLLAGRSNDWTLTLGNFDGDIDEVRISNIVR